MLFLDCIERSGHSLRDSEEVLVHRLKDIVCRQHKAQAELLVRAECLHDDLAHTLLVSKRKAEDPQWVAPGARRLWSRVRYVARDRRFEYCVDAQVDFVLRRRAPSKGPANPRQGKAETEDQRFGRLQDFFMAYREGMCRIQPSPSMTLSSPPRLGADCPPSVLPRQRSKVLVGTLEAEDAVRPSLMDWETRACKSRCSAGVWSLRSSLPPLSDPLLETFDGSTNMGEGSPTSSAEYLDGGVFSEWEASVSEIRRTTSQAAVAAAMEGNGPVNNDVLDHLFYGLGSRKPLPSKSLVFGQAGTVRPEVIHSVRKTDMERVIDEEVALRRPSSRSSSNSSLSHCMSDTQHTFHPNRAERTATTEHRWQPLTAQRARQLMCLDESNWKEQSQVLEQRSPSSALARSLSASGGCTSRPTTPTPQRASPSASQLRRSSSYTSLLRAGSAASERAGPKKKKREPREFGLPPIKSSGVWSDPRTCAPTQRCAPQLRQYLQDCSDKTLIPELTPFVTGHSSTLTASGRQLLDRDLQAIVPLVCKVELVDGVDLAGNTKLTDTVMAPLIMACTEKPPPSAMTTLSLRQCRSVGTLTVQSIIDLVGSRMGSTLQHIDISGIHLAVKVQGPFCRAVGGAVHLTTLNMSDTGLSGASAAQCVEIIAAAENLRTLDLGWNSFQPAAMSTLGKALARPSSIESLRLPSSAGALAPDGTSPILHFLERLPQSVSLQALDISLNRMDCRGALVLEDALQSNRHITDLNVSQNPLGARGMRHLLRWLTSEGCPVVSFDYSQCASSELDASAAASTCRESFCAATAGGCYRLDLAKPHHRSHLRMLCRHADRLAVPVAEAFTDVTSQPPSIEFPQKGKDGVWAVHEEGTLSFTYSPEKGMGKAVADKWDALAVLEQYESQTKARLNFHGAVRLLAKWHSVMGWRAEQVMMLAALAKDFLLPPAIIRHLCKTRELTMEVMGRLITSIEGARCGRFVSLLALPSIGEHVITRNRGFDYFLFNVQAPTGRYRLDLSVPGDYGIAEKLALLNRWEMRLALEAKRADTSQRGDRSFFRNEMHQGVPCESRSVASNGLPDTGTISFDYVTSRRQARDAAVVDDDAADAIFCRLSSSLCPVHAKVKVLQAVADRLVLTAAMLRLLLRIFDGATVQADVFVMLFAQVRDLHNEKMLRASWDDEVDYANVCARLGHLNVFPFLQPEGFAFEYDLSAVDERASACFILKLTGAEGSDNLHEPGFTSFGKDEELEELHSAYERALLERNGDRLPSSGVFKGRYACNLDDRAFHKMRLPLFETYCPASGVSETTMCWWTQLGEVPPQVLEMVYWMLPRFESSAEVFEKLEEATADPEGAGSGDLSAKDFEAALATLGCDRFAGPTEKQSIMTIFKFLDVAGEGTISKVRWCSLEGLRREVFFRVLELAHFLRVVWRGDAAKWQRCVPVRDGGGVNIGDFSAICRKLGFYGSPREAFEYMDPDATGVVGFDAVRALMESVTRSGLGLS